MCNVLIHINSFLKFLFAPNLNSSSWDRRMWVLFNLFLTIIPILFSGWPIQKNHYILFPCLSVLFALLYSLPPLFGFGKYALDFSCQTCALDMVLPVTWHRYIALSIFILRSIKSTGFMWVLTNFTYYWLTKSKLTHLQFN